MIIFDASPLIHLAKIGKLDFVIDLFQILHIPQAVYEETVINGLANNHSEANIIKNFIDLKKILVLEANIPPNLRNFLHPGECEAISLALSETEENLLIMDEKKGRSIAREYNISIYGTLGILLILYREKQINQKQYLNNLRKYADKGWISIKLYEKFRDEGINSNE